MHMSLYGDFWRFDYIQFYFPSPTLECCTLGFGVGGGGQVGVYGHQLLWDSPKNNVRHFLLPKSCHWSSIQVWGHFAFANVSSCPYYHRTLCLATVGNFGFPFLWLMGIIPSSCPLYTLTPCIVSPNTLDLSMSMSIFFHPVLGRWGHHITEYTLYFIPFMLFKSVAKGYFSKAIAVFCPFRS